MYSYPSRRQRLQNWLTGLVLFLILSSCASAPPAPKPTPGISLRPFVDTWNNIHVFQTFDYNISDPAAAASRYDFVWGVKVPHVATFRSGNANIFITYYTPFQIDWGTFSNEYARHNVAYWKKVHPDWILYKCDRTTPAHDNEHTPLDFANPAVVSWEVETYAKPASQARYDGIALDGLVLRNQYQACGTYVNGKWVGRYTGQFNDPQWRAAIITWLARMQQALHSLPHPLALIPNVDFDDLSLSDPQIQQLVNHIDGLADESGFTHYGSGYLTDNAWVEKIRFIESIQKRHKPYYIVDLFPSVGRTETQWALASYLMGKEHAAYLFISTPGGYGSATWYAEYDTQIGTPRGPMYQAQNVYFRNYSRGVSIVNPSATSTYAVSLTPGNFYTDVYGNPVGRTVALAPHSGLVLLSTA